MGKGRAEYLTVLAKSRYNTETTPKVSSNENSSQCGSFHYAKAFGDEVDKPHGTNSVYWLASVTNFITTIAVMQCVEKGQLDLDGDIAKVLPESKDPQILTGFNEKNEAIFKPSTKPVTLRQVMLLVEETPTLANRSIVEKFPRQFLVFGPGERWVYSLGLDWAGLVDATFHPELREDLQARKARNWERDSQSLKEQLKPVYAENTLDNFGGGGSFATVEDLLKIYQSVLIAKLLRPETAKEMFQPHLENIRGLDKPEEYSSSTRNAIWNTVPDDVPLNFRIGV
ncbi:uncharacterized protein EAE98_011178 [Botrytis deweyae]|uniref:Beta-lactamase-related domain-containing protein n=1 Tax=Botrytis deweyae TaxID=2478750 RepID=A0ABQ7I6P3_9HELO|nr:uncharacterized protein EAE98_011178 [Botrytis deweyae]KAF7915312.1 hypothetical protein EAE98_011178 [Botrytis deweyae]